MKKLDDYQKYFPILSKAKLFEGIPLEHYPQIFNFLQASILSFEKDELIQHLGEPLLYSGIVLDGTVEGSFINENYSKINMNHFETWSIICRSPGMRANTIQSNTAKSID